MQSREPHHRSKHIFIATTLLIAISAGCLSVPNWATASEAPAAKESEEGAANPHTHMSETLRSSIRKVAVVPGADPTRNEIAGSYEKDTPGLTGGVLQGAALGSPSIQVGVINVGVSMSELILPGAIAGGLSGQAKRKIQEFRDALAEDIASATNQPLTHSKLALHVHQDLRSVPDLEARLFSADATIPDDTQAILYASINEVIIDVRGDEAILKTTAEITVHRQSDGTTLHRDWVYYQDQDTLSNWTKDELALWHDYSNFARHYLGREIAAEVFTRVNLRHQLQPRKTETLSIRRSNVWQGTSKAKAPALAWDLKLLGGDSYGPWVDEIDESNTFYDLEIYDNQRLVYGEQQISEPSHKLTTDLDACKTYRWSVRPSYHVGGSITYGEWMRSPSATNGEAGSANVGEKASRVPAYIQHFPSLKIDCRAK